MVSFLQRMTESYTDLMQNQSDPRVKDWPMMSGILPTLLICIFYAYFVKIFGPKLMENRKPFILRHPMIYYNLFQVVFSSWLLYEALKNGWWNDYSFRCQPVDYSNSPKAIGMAKVCWWYYIAKFSELIDTLLFVLRKKNGHISTLHVCHHGMMPISTWFGVKFVAGGHTTFMCTLNSFVHIVMYGYYLLAACGPKVQPYLWWKKYLTTLQLIQFVVVMIHTFQLLFIECNYPKIFAVYIGLNAIFFFDQFRHFYMQSYIKKRSTKSPTSLSFNDKEQ